LNISSGNLLGTIVLERIIDVACLVAFLLIISFYVISDQQVISQIFGTEGWTVNVYLLFPALILLLILGTWAGFRILRYLENQNKIQSPFFTRFVEYVSRFWKGLISVKDVKNWPLFIFYTIAIWTGYTIMAYLPFWMLDLHQQYNLGVMEAMVITIISAVGVTVPTPGGIGSYHLFVQQSLWVLFSVPLVTALTYATIAHGVTVILVFITGAAVFWFDKYYTLKSKFVRRWQ
jgi:hypothetical protein